MAELPSIPNLDPNTPQIDPESTSAPHTAGALAKTVTDPALRTRLDPADRPGSIAADQASRPVTSPTKRPSDPPPPPAEPPEATPNDVQDSVEEVLQHTSAQTLKLSHLEDVLTALNRTLTDLQDEMHAGFSELRAVTEQSATNALGNRETAIRGDREPATQNSELIEDQVLLVGKRQSLLLIIALVQALLLAVTLVAILTLRSSTPVLAPLEPITPATTVAPAIAAPPAGEPLESSSGPGEETKHKDIKKKKGRHH